MKYQNVILIAVKLIIDKTSEIELRPLLSTDIKQKILYINKRKSKKKNFKI